MDIGPRWQEYCFMISMCVKYVSILISTCKVEWWWLRCNHESDIIHYALKYNTSKIIKSYNTLFI